MTGATPYRHAIEELAPCLSCEAIDELVAALKAICNRYRLVHSLRSNATAGVIIEELHGLESSLRRARRHLEAICRLPAADLWIEGVQVEYLESTQQQVGAAARALVNREAWEVYAPAGLQETLIALQSETVQHLGELKQRGWPSALPPLRGTAAKAAHPERVVFVGGLAKVAESALGRRLRRHKKAPGVPDPFVEFVGRAVIIAGVKRHNDDVELMGADAVYRALRQSDEKRLKDGK